MQWNHKNYRNLIVKYFLKIPNYLIGILIIFFSSLFLYLFNSLILIPGNFILFT